MRRLALHQSVGNLYKDVQRNDSAGVIPRITIPPVDCFMSIIHVTDTPKLRYVHICSCRLVCYTVYEQLYEQQISLSIAARTLYNRTEKKKKSKTSGGKKRDDRAAKRHTGG